jgi:hypothetical protein
VADPKAIGDEKKLFHGAMPQEVLMTTSKNHVTVVNPMETLLLDCAIFKLQISIPSGVKKLNWEKLGIPQEFIDGDLITSGGMYIVTHEEIQKLNSIRSKATQMVERHSLEFSIGRLVPGSKIQDLRDGLAQLQTEFQAAIDDLARRYESIKSALMSKWHREAIRVSTRISTDAEFVFGVMNEVESCFAPWSKFASGFGFTWSEYRDLNGMAAEFIAESNRGLLLKMREFAENFKARLSSSGVSDRNLAPIRKWLDDVKDIAGVFHNERINAMMNDLATWTEVGSDELIRDSQDVRRAVDTALDGIMEATNGQLDEIAAASVMSLTSFARNIEE